MATYVLLIKELEDAEKVIYKFGPSEERLGRVQLVKKTGDYMQLDPVPNTDTTFYYNRAVLTLLKCLNKDGGIFPPMTCFAS